MAKLSVQERLERLREAGRKQSGQGGQQSSPAPAATSGRTTAGMTVRERLNRLKEAGRQQSPSLPTVTSQAAGETAGRKKAGSQQLPESRERSHPRHGRRSAGRRSCGRCGTRPSRNS